MTRNEKLKHGDRTLQRMLLASALAPAPEPPAPVLMRSAAGTWTASFPDSPPQCWKLFARTSDNPAWSDFGEMTPDDFPAPDSDIVPDNVTWWQIKVCGVDGDDNQNTPFSNVISSGPVPAA